MTRYQINKIYALGLKGNVCKCCGKAVGVVSGDYAFHHNASSGKVANISDLLDTCGKKAIAKELRKTSLLCRECHNNLHSELGKKTKRRDSLEFIARG